MAMRDASVEEAKPPERKPAVKSAKAASEEEARQAAAQPAMMPANPETAMSAAAGPAEDPRAVQRPRREARRGIAPLPDSRWAATAELGALRVGRSRRLAAPAPDREETR